MLLAQSITGMLLAFVMSWPDVQADLLMHFAATGLLTFFHADFGKEIPSRTLWRGPSWNCPLSKLCTVPFALQNRALFEGEKRVKRSREKGGKRGGQQRGQKGKKDAWKQVRLTQSLRPQPGTGKLVHETLGQPLWRSLVIDVRLIAATIMQVKRNIPLLGNEYSAEVFLTEAFGNPLGSWTSAPSGHGYPRPNACFSRILSALTEVLGRDLRANDPWMSAGYPARRLTLWAEFTFLIYTQKDYQINSKFFWFGNYFTAIAEYHFQKNILVGIRWSTAHAFYRDELIPGTILFGNHRTGITDNNSKLIKFSSVIILCV